MTINHSLEAEIFLRECKRTLQEIVIEYYQLSTLDVLTNCQAERMAEILSLAETDPLLSFLLDETDHITGHVYGFIEPKKIRVEQEMLKQAIDRTWLKFIVSNGKESNENYQT